MGLRPLLQDQELLKFRTRHCERFVRLGKCSFGDRCQYSHDLEWTRRPLWKYEYGPDLCTSVTLSLLADGKEKVSHMCPLQRKCCSSHTREEQIYHPAVYKTVLCGRFIRSYGRGGNMSNGSRKCNRYFCPFAHGCSELQSPDCVVSILKQHAGADILANTKLLTSRSDTLLHNLLYNQENLVPIQFDVDDTPAPHLRKKYLGVLMRKDGQGRSVNGWIGLQPCNGLHRYEVYSQTENKNIPPSLESDVRSSLYDKNMITDISNIRSSCGLTTSEDNMDGLIGGSLGSSNNSDIASESSNSIAGRGRSPRCDQQYSEDGGSLRMPIGAAGQDETWFQDDRFSSMSLDVPNVNRQRRSFDGVGGMLDGLSFNMLADYNTLNDNGEVDKLLMNGLVHRDEEYDTRHVSLCQKDIIPYGVDMGHSDDVEGSMVIFMNYLMSLPAMMLKTQLQLKISSWVTWISKRVFRYGFIDLSSHHQAIEQNDIPASILHPLNKHFSKSTYWLQDLLHGLPSISGNMTQYHLRSQDLADAVIYMWNSLRESLECDGDNCTSFDDCLEVVGLNTAYIIHLKSQSRFGLLLFLFRVLNSVDATHKSTITSAALFMILRFVPITLYPIDSDILRALFGESEDPPSIADEQIDNLAFDGYIDQILEKDGFMFSVDDGFKTRQLVQCDFDTSYSMSSNKQSIIGGVHRKPLPSSLLYTDCQHHAHSSSQSSSGIDNVLDMDYLNGSDEDIRLTHNALHKNRDPSLNYYTDDVNDLSNSTRKLTQCIVDDAISQPSTSFIDECSRQQSNTSVASLLSPMSTENNQTLHLDKSTTQSTWDNSFDLMDVIRQYAPEGTTAVNKHFTVSANPTSKPLYNP